MANEERRNSYKIDRVAAYQVDGVTYNDLKSAEVALRAWILEDEIARLDNDAALDIAREWDRIEAKVREAMRGL